MVPAGTGGIAGLSKTLDEHKIAIRADFQQFYQLDIADVWRGTLKASRALELIDGLAHVPQSRYRAEALGDESFHGWDRATELLASIFDALQTNTVVTAKAAGGKPKSPDDYPRPVVLTQSDIEMPPLEELTIDNFPIFAVMAVTQN